MNEVEPVPVGTTEADPATSDPVVATSKSEEFTVVGSTDVLNMAKYETLAELVVPATVGLLGVRDVMTGLGGLTT